MAGSLALGAMKSMGGLVRMRFVVGQLKAFAFPTGSR